MVNKTLINILHKRITEDYKKLRKVINKLHKSSSSISFIKKALYNNVIPTFAKVKGRFLGNTTVKNTARRN